MRLGKDSSEYVSVNSPTANVLHRLSLLESASDAVSVGLAHAALRRCRRVTSGLKLSTLALVHTLVGPVLLHHLHVGCIFTFGLHRFQPQLLLSHAFLIGDFLGQMVPFEVAQVLEVPDVIPVVVSFLAANWRVVQCQGNICCTPTSTGCEESVS